jgi:hypothetical protein
VIDDGIMISRGKLKSLREKPAPAPLCPPQILHDVMQDESEIE